MPIDPQTLRQLHPGLGTARALQRRPRPADSARKSRVRALDELLDGGLQPGGLVEIVGRRSSGRFSILMQTLAAFTCRGDVASLIDLGDGLDPQAASDAGVDLSRLLWVRPEHIKSALVAAELLLNTGFPLVVIDLGSPPVPGGRGPEASWIRLARTASTHQGILLVSSPYRASGTTARIIVESRREATHWSGSGQAPRLLGGISAQLELAKAIGRGPTPPRSAEWRSRVHPPQSLGG